MTKAEIRLYEGEVPVLDTITVIDKEYNEKQIAEWWLQHLWSYPGGPIPSGYNSIEVTLTTTPVKFDVQEFDLEQKP